MGGCQSVRVNDDESARVSRRLSHALRHAPDRYGLELDLSGWAPVADVLTGLSISRATLDHVVASSDKQRFAFDGSGSRIRANQGHSVPVELGLEPVAPPPVLYHGTVPRFVDAICADGLRPMARHHVHLSADLEAAIAVGSRRGAPVVFAVDAQRLHSDGSTFFVSDNGVWLVDAVPPGYLTEVQP